MNLPACKLKVNFKNKPKISAVKMAHVSVWTVWLQVAETQMIVKRKRGEREREDSLLR